MNKSKLHAFSLVAAGLALATASAQALEPVEQLGKSIFFDQSLSLTARESEAKAVSPR